VKDCLIMPRIIIMNYENLHQRCLTKASLEMQCI
jgi:hypothetical protein